MVQPTVQHVVEQSEADVAGLAQNLSRAEKEKGARIALGQVTFDDIVSGKITNFGGKDFNYPKGISLNSEKYEDIDPTTKKQKIYKGRKGIEELLKNPDGYRLLEESFNGLKSQLDTNQLGVIIPYNDPITNKAAVESQPEDNKIETKIAKTVSSVAKKITGYDSQDKITQFVDDRKKVKGFLQTAGIEDEMIQQIFVDKFETGNFFKEMDKALDDGIRLIPYYLPLLLQGAGHLAKAGFSGDFSASWQDTSFKRAEYAAKLRKFYEDGLGIKGVTPASLLNENLHKELKSRLVDLYEPELGQKYYEERHTLEGTPKQYIGDELATTLNDYAFKELPTSEKFLRFAVENVMIGGGIAKYTAVKDIKMGKLVSEVKRTGKYTSKDYELDSAGKRIKDTEGNYVFKKKDFGMDLRTISALSDRQIEKLIVNNNTSSEFMKRFNNFTYRIGDTFKVRGSAAAGANEVRQIETIKDLNDRIDTAYDAYSTRLAGGALKSDPEVAKLRGEIRDLVEARNRQHNLSVFGYQRRSPIVMGALKDETLIAFGQAAGYELGGNVSFLGPEMGEVGGALFTALGGLKLSTAPIRLVASGLDRSMLRSFSGGSMAAMEMIDSVGGILGAIDPRIDLRGLLADRSLNNLARKYMDETNTILTRKQLAALRSVSDITGNMSAEEHLKMMKYLRESHELENDVVNAFPPELQDEARAAFKEGFANASQIPGLMAFDGLLSSRMNVKDLQNFNLEGINAVINESSILTQQANLVGKKLLTLGKQGNISPENFKVIEKFVNDTQQGIFKFQKHMAEKEILYGDAIKQYFRNIVSHPSELANEQLDNGLLDRVIEGLTIVETNKYIREQGDAYNAATSIVERNQIMKKVHNDIMTEAYTTLQDSFGDLRQIKASQTGQRYSEILTERLFDLRLNEIYSRGKLAYAEIDPMLKSITTDITRTAGDFLQEYANVTNNKIIANFSPQGSFARSVHGKRLNSTFSTMAGRALREGPDGFDEKELDYFREIYKKEYNTRPSDAQIYFSLKDEPEIYGLEGGDLPSLNATFYELEEMRKYFRTAAYDKSGGEKNILNNFSDKLEEILKENEGAYASLKEARRKYRVEVGEALEDGTLINEIKSSIKRKRVNVPTAQARLRALDEAELSNTVDEVEPKIADKYMMKKGAKLPEQWFKELNDDILKFTETGSDEDKRKVQRSWERVRQSFGTALDDKITDDISTNSYGFDLTSTRGGMPLAGETGIGLTQQRSSELGKVKFDILKEVMESVIYRNWANLRLNALEEANLLTNPNGVSLPKFSVPDQKGFKKIGADLEQRISSIEQILKVPVRQFDDGNVVIQDVKMVDLNAMIVKERDIAKLVKNYKEGRESYESLRTYFKNFTEGDPSLKKEAAASRVRVSEASLQKLYKALGLQGKGYPAFYADFIESVSVDSFNVTKDLYTKGGKVLDVTSPIIMTADEFDEATLTALISGVLDKGAYGSVARPVQGIDGKMTAAKAFGRPIDMLDEFDKENIQAIMGELVGDKHLADVNLIMSRFRRELANESFRDIRNLGMGGVMRPVSPNEIISRAFNLARGMVSPTYVTAEMLIRIASSNGVNMMELVLRDKDVSRVFSELMADPKGFDVQQVGSILPKLQEFVFTELFAQGITDLQPLLDEESYNKVYYNN